MSNLKSYRGCFVPLCTNTTKATPEKMFLNVPQDAKRRNKWFKAARRINTKSTSNFFCCEDHFNLTEDMDNYLYYTMMGGKAKTKVDVVPHKFTCQINRKRHSNTTPRPIAEKRRKQQIVQEILSESSEIIKIKNTQESAAATMSDYNFPNVEIDFKLSNVAPGEKVSGEIHSDIRNHTAAVQANIRPRYRSVSVQCALPPFGIDKTLPSKKLLHPTSTSKLLEEAQRTITSCSYTNSYSMYPIYEATQNVGSRKSHHNEAISHVRVLTPEQTMVESVEPVAVEQSSPPSSPVPPPSQQKKGRGRPRKYPPVPPPLVKRPRGRPRLNPVVPQEPVKQENYDISNMPYGDIEYLTKPLDENSEDISLHEHDFMEPLVEIKTESIEKAQPEKSEKPSATFLENIGLFENSAVAKIGECTISVANNAAT